MTSLDELLAQLGSAGSFQDLLRAALHPDVALMLDRCAWVRTFDADVFQVLGEGVRDVSFEQVVTSPGVRPVPGREGVYRLRRDARTAALSRLAPGGEAPRELRELSGRLALHYRRRGRKRDELYQLIVANPSEAITLLQELYAKADARFDVPACQALLDLVHSRGALGGWKLVEEQNRLERYLAARIYWRDQYRQASRFLTPSGTVPAFERLLGDDGPDLLQLFGSGGMGKTMHLYDLMARRAVPEPLRLACALLDFDLMQIGNVLREPWLVLPEIAHQVNQQLQEPLFDDFLKQFGRLRARVLLPQFAVEASVPGQLGDDTDEEREQVRDAVRAEFLGVLGQPTVARQVLIAFDTLERIAHTGGATPAGAHDAFVAELAALSRELPGIRMVLSGRYDLREEIEGVERRIGPMEHLPLYGLDEDEARRYLRERRKLSVGDDVIDAAIATAGSGGERAQPLMLAMIADAIALDPAIPADVVRGLDEPGLYHLTQRVILQIPDIRVRWLLRYGVIPRLLTRRFVADVVVEFLRDVMSGETQDDDPAKDRRPEGVPTSDAFPVDPAADLDPDELWAELRRYAAAYSWVEAVEPDVLRFHESVAAPMRALLREQPVFAKLNQAASDYFERCALDAPGEQARLLREAFHHRLVLDPDSAVADWQRRTRDMATDPAVAAALADEVLDTAVREPERLPREVVAQARVERALANLRQATAPGAARGSRLWDLAREDIEQADCVLAPDDPRLAAGRAALLVRDGAPAQALTLVSEHLRPGLRPAEDLILHVRRGDALTLTGAHEADDEYVAAIGLGPVSGLRDVDVATLHWKRARALDARDDLELAQEACTEGLAVAPEGSAARAALLLMRGRLDLRLGTPSKSAASTEVPLRRADRLRHEANLLLVSADLGLWDPDRALQRASDALAQARSRHAETAEAGIELAECREIRARARAARGDERSARKDLEAAALIWDGISSDRASRCFVEIATLHLRGVRDLQLADAALSRAESLTTERGVTERAATELGCVRLRRAEYQAWDRTEDPQAMVGQVLVDLRSANAAPGVRARAALEGLCLPGHEPARIFLHELNEALDEIRPVGARLAMLDDLERCPSLTGLRRAEVRRFRDLLAVQEPSQLEDRYPPRDRQVALVRLADVARVTGDPTESHRLLETAHALSPEVAETRFTRVQLAKASVRVEHTTLAEDIGVPELLATNERERPGLNAPAPLTTAEELVDRDRLREAALGLLWSTILWSVRRLVDDPHLLGRVLSQLHRRAPRPSVLEGPSGPRPESLPPAVRTEHPTLNVFLRMDGDTLVVRALLPHGRSPRDTRFTDAHPLVRAVVQAIARPGTLEPQLAALFTDPAAAGPGLAEVLLPGGRIGDLVREDPVDVRLWTQGTPLAMVPWELATAGDGTTLLSRDPRVRYLYRGFLDAEEHPAPPRPAQPTVLVIRPRVRGRRQSPGMIKTTLVPLEDQYAAAGMRVVLAESVELESLMDLVAADPPDIVHVAAGFVGAGGGAAVDISSGVAGQVGLSGLDRDRLTATGLASAISGADGVGSLVVLDPPAVSHVSVHAAQLVLRNAFAAEVAATVAVPAVIATGLVRYAAQDALYRHLPRALAAGHPVATVVEGIRALANEVPASADAFGFPPTALFAACPLHRVRSGP